MNRTAKRLGLILAVLLGLDAIVFVGSYLTNAGQYVVSATTTDDPSLPGRTVQGYRYHLELLGLPTRPVVIFVHGGPGGDYRSLLPLEPLSDEYQLAFYDQRGTGLSPRVSDAMLSFNHRVEDLHAIVNAISPRDPVRLVGHSFGATIAAAYLERHPERVSHAALAEPPFLTAEGGDAWYAGIHGGEAPLSVPLMMGSWKALMQSLHVYGPDDDARRDFLGQRLLELDAPGHPLRAYHCDGDRKRAHAPAFRFGARARDAILEKSMNEEGKFIVSPLTAEVKRFPHKVLLIAGTCNTVMGVETQRKNLALFAQAELAVIEDAGHTLFGEQPEASLAVLRRYFAENHSAVVASD